MYGSHNYAQDTLQENSKVQWQVLVLFLSGNKQVGGQQQHDSNLVACQYAQPKWKKCFQNWVKRKHLGNYIFIYIYVLL